MRVPLGQLLDHRQKMADRASQTVEADNDERVAGGDLAEELR